MVANYADVIVMRHFIEGAAQYASEVTDVPIVNAGDGAHQHPSQCMLDLYSIYKTQGTLEALLQGARHQVYRAYRLQREGHCRCRHSLHDTCPEGAFQRPDGV